MDCAFLTKIIFENYFPLELRIKLSSAINFSIQITACYSQRKDIVDGYLNLIMWLPSIAKIKQEEETLREMVQHPQSIFSTAANKVDKVSIAHDMATLIKDFRLSVRVFSEPKYRPDCDRFYTNVRILVC